jgi:NAD-dependent dihydropyrimidine dehydrogenase PreA subunit
MKKKEAYKIVIKDLKRGIVCKDKDYCVGCFSCELLRLSRSIQSIYDFEFNSKVLLPTTKKKK